MGNDGGLVLNDGTPIGGPADFYREVHFAYGAFDALARDLREKVSMGAILVALTRLQLEKNAEMTLGAVMQALEEAGDGQ